MNEQDRKLLELAAKAAGVDVVFIGKVAVICEPIGGASGGWSPLDDDGDAFRLMVNLGIELRPDSHSVVAAASGAWESEKYLGDKYAATRRAIVRAAAEIGRNAAQMQLLRH